MQDLRQCAACAPYRTSISTTTREETIQPHRRDCGDAGEQPTAARDTRIDCQHHIVEMLGEQPTAVRDTRIDCQHHVCSFDVSIHLVGDRKPQSEEAPAMLQRMRIQPSISVQPSPGD
ncbi:hypothetical protein E2320_022549 [Naja naja]|nr:hypothetical protein E2320_022549 [Naja naja]